MSVSCHNNRSGEPLFDHLVGSGGTDGSELLSGIRIDGEFDLRRRLDRLPTRRSASVMLVCLPPRGRVNSQRL